MYRTLHRLHYRIDWESSSRSHRFSLPSFCPAPMAIRVLEWCFEMMLSKFTYDVITSRRSEWKQINWRMRDRNFSYPPSIPGCPGCPESVSLLRLLAMSAQERFKISIYVPKTHEDAVKKAGSFSVPAPCPVSLNPPSVGTPISLPPTSVQSRSRTDRSLSKRLIHHPWQQ